MAEAPPTFEPAYKAVSDLAKTGTQLERSAPQHDSRPNFFSAAGNFAIQRAALAHRPAEDTVFGQCACGGTCDECTKKQLQRKASSDAPDVPHDFPQTLSGSSGAPLGHPLREAMESQFDEGFDSVRVHNDAAAGEAAQQINARAFTTGNDIYFAQGHYQPDSPAGQALLAHELTHVLQQRNGPVGEISQKSAINSPTDSFEKEAERSERDFLSGTPSRVAGGTSPAIQRKTGDSQIADPAADVDDVLTIPSEKGGGTVRKEYEAASSDGRLSNIAKFTRPSTSTLRGIWKDKVGCPFPEDLKPGGDVCEVDHIVELQVGGTNNKENLQLLEKGHNASSGSNIRAQVEKIVNNHPEAKALRFRKLKSESPVSDECKKREVEMMKDKKCKSGQGGNTFTVKFGKREIDVDISKSTGPNVYDISGRRGQIVAGIQFSTLTLFPDKDGAGEIAGEITSTAATFVKNKTQKKITIGIQKGVAALSPSSSAVGLLFPFLSEAQMNFSLDENGLKGETQFTPTLPLLRKGVVHVKVDQGKFSAGAKFGSTDITIPIPGLTVTDCNLEAGFEETHFYARGKLAFKVSNFAKAELTATADPAGFVAKGTVDLSIPGIDKANGTVTYSGGKLAGRIEIGKDKPAFPGVKSATLIITISEGEIAGRGEVVLGVPGVKKGTLGLTSDKKGGFAVTGAVELEIPGVKSSSIELLYKDGDLSGQAMAGLDIPGLSGAGLGLTIRYAKGAITGDAALDYKKGKLSGKVHVALNEKRKLSGGGELGYEIIPSLVAGVGVEIRENGTAKISGSLKIPEKIDLFPQKAIEKTLFSLGVQIPIFAIPLGTRSVGLVAEIGADLKARAGFGPGQIRKLKVAASFDPSNEASKFEFSGGGELYVPAFAELSLGVHGGIGLSLAIASATGGIELVGALGLQGALSANVQIQYKNNQFTVDAAAELSAEPIIKFSVNAYVKVDVLLIGEVYRKDWKLASKDWGSGLKIGLRFPVHYEFGKPFELSLKQVEFIVPEIDYKKAVKDLLPMK